jgi:diguanylate cyclase
MHTIGAHELPPTGEVAQTSVRLAVALAYLGVLGLIAALGFGYLVRAAWGPAGAYALFALIWMFVVKGELIPESLRKPFALLLDHLIFAAGYYWGEAGFALVFWAPIFASIGYGLRYGRQYVYASGLASAVLMPLAMLHSSFWSEHLLVSAGIVVASCILPAYAFRLADSIARSRAEIEARADQLETASRMDVLTGLLNRSGFFKSLSHLLDQQAHSAVLYVDLDNFKTVNDSCGHAVGDRVLQEAAGRLRSCLRNTDCVARLGGDEFGICVPNLFDVQAAHRLAEKIIESIASIRIPEFGDRPVLGASVGVCLLPHREATCVDSVTQLADGLMYQAKRAGKNGFVSSASEENPAGTWVSSAAQ